MSIKGIANQPAYREVQTNTSTGSNYSDSKNISKAASGDGLRVSKVTGVNNEEKEKSNPATDKVRLENAVKEINNKLTKTRCEYSFNEEVNRVAIRVVDRETEEVIREIPPEESLKALEKMWEMVGLLVDEKR